MFIRLFIRTTNSDVANETIENVLSHIKKENIKSKRKIEPYWKYNYITVGEIDIELFKELDNDEKKSFLNYLSNKWRILGDNEAISSLNIDECCLKYNLEMIDVHFK